MFSNESWEEIISAVNKKDKTCLEVIMITPFGPTAIKRNLEKELKLRGVKINNTINWWSASSPFGVLEIEIEGNYKLYLVWSQGEKNQVLKVTPKDDIDIKIIIESLASSNVSPGVMRTFSHARFPGG